MRCDNFPKCGHVTPPACLAARAANIQDGDEDVCFTTEELATLEGLRRLADRTEMRALCTHVAHEIMAALRLLGVALTIEPEWDNRPVINMDMSAVEAARDAIRDMPSRSQPQQQARRLLGLALSASQVTLTQQRNAGVVAALQAIYEQAREIRQALRSK